MFTTCGWQVARFRSFADKVIWDAMSLRAVSLPMDRNHRQQAHGFLNSSATVCRARVAHLALLVAGILVLLPIRPVLSFEIVFNIDRIFAPHKEQRERWFLNRFTVPISLISCSNQGIAPDIVFVVPLITNASQSC